MSGFRCASEAQTSWLRQHGPNNRKPGTAAKVYVVTESANPHDVVAFFAWCMSATASETLPARLRQGGGAATRFSRFFFWRGSGYTAITKGTA